MRKMVYALLIAAVSLVSCTKEFKQEKVGDNTVRVCIGADFLQTKSEVVYDANTNQRSLKFTEGDRLFVYSEISGTLAPTLYLAGYLDAVNVPAAGATEASFSGDLHVFSIEGTDTYKQSTYAFSTADPFSECENFKVTLVHKDSEAGDATDRDYDEILADDGNVANISYRLGLAVDANVYMTSDLPVTADSYDAVNKCFVLAPSGDPLLNCYITGVKANAVYQVKYLHGTDRFDENTIVYDGFATADASGVSFACPAVRGEGLHALLLVDQAAGDRKIVYLGSRTLAENKVYAVTRAARNYVDIGELTSDYTTKFGDFLTGTLHQNVKISIGAGLSVMLGGVSINADEAWTSAYGGNAGLTCVADANIILADGTENVVKSTGYDYPGILIPHCKTGAENTLYITGDGKLVVSALNQRYGSGIGGQSGKDCGNIYIDGGDITATSYNGAAPIGASGSSGWCGTITITEGIKKVTANKDAYAPHCIGIGSGGYCPSVLIDGVDASSADWDGSGMEHLQLVRSRPTKNGANIYYKTWTLTPKKD